ncbi:GyrI-like domain-containing protein [Ketobacter alkanivorans]|uniref:GyrI-like domain-containing protein n=1 Tax=Ketobacter alkanivorans TaxID=1917421 RepID=UPI00389920BF
MAAAPATPLLQTNIHNGPLPDLHKTLKYTWGSWLPKSKYEYAPSPELVIYPENYVACEVDAQLRLYVPVQRE